MSDALIDTAVAAMLAAVDALAVLDDEQRVRALARIDVLAPGLAIADLEDTARDRVELLEELVDVQLERDIAAAKAARLADQVYALGDLLTYRRGHAIYTSALPADLEPVERIHRTMQSIVGLECSEEARPPLPFDYCTLEHWWTPDVGDDCSFPVDDRIACLGLAFPARAGG